MEFICLLKCSSPSFLEYLYQRLKRLFSQPMFTSVLYNINTRDNTENQNLTTKPRRKQLLILISFPQSLLDYNRIPVNNDAMIVSQNLRPKIREKQRQCFHFISVLVSDKTYAVEVNLSHYFQAPATQAKIKLP